MDWKNPGGLGEGTMQTPANKRNLEAAVMSDTVMFRVSICD